MKGYRSENFAGQMERNLGNIVEFEIFELENYSMIDSIIMNTIGQSLYIDIDNQSREKIMKMLNECIYSAYQESMKNMYGLWLCASTKDSNNSYNFNDEEWLFDEYETSSEGYIDDLGKEGRLYVFKKFPIPERTGISLNAE